MDESQAPRGKPSHPGLKLKPDLDGLSRSASRLALVVSILFWPNLGQADIGIPMLVVGFPFVLAALIPAVLIETWLTTRELGLEFRPTLKVVGLANAVSTLLGYPFVWILQFLVQIGLTLLAQWVGVTPASWIATQPIFQVMGFILSAAWLMPIKVSLWWMIPVAGIIALVPAFFASVRIEKWVTSKFWPTLENERLRKAVLRANLGSYAFLLLVMFAILGKNYTSLDPITRPLLLHGADVWKGRGEEGRTITVRRGVSVEQILTDAQVLPDVVAFDFSTADVHGHLGGLKNFPDVVSLSFQGSTMDDSDLAALAPLTHVRTLRLLYTEIHGSGLVSLMNRKDLALLDLRHTNIDDESLVTLKNFQNLRELNLGHCKVSGTGLKAMGPLPELRSLDLSENPLTDAGAAELNSFKKVENLTLGDTRLTNEGLRAVRGLSQLKVLHLWHTRVSDDGLKSLESLSELTSLSIGLPGVTDAGLVHLEKCRKLEVLDLNGSNVHGPGLVHLKEMGKLQRLWLRETPVTQPWIDTVKALLPQAAVFH